MCTACHSVFWDEQDPGVRFKLLLHLGRNMYTYAKAVILSCTVCKFMTLPFTHDCCIGYGRLAGSNATTRTNLMLMCWIKISVVKLYSRTWKGFAGFFDTIIRYLLFV